MKLATVFLGLYVLSAAMSPSGLPAGSQQPERAKTLAFTISPVVKRGDPSPNGGEFFPCHGTCLFPVGLAGQRALGSDGRIIFKGVYTRFTLAECGDGTFLSKGPGDTVLLDDVCHATPFGRFLETGPANINNAGQVVFEAFLPTGLPPPRQNANSLFLRTDTGVERVISTYDSTPFGNVGPCAFSEPFITDNGDIFFSGCTSDQEIDGIFVSSNGQLRRLLQDGNQASGGGAVVMNFVGSIRPNNQGDVVFKAFRIFPNGDATFGLFLYSSRGITKVETTGDLLPDGHVIPPLFAGNGLADINDRRQIVFAVAFKPTDASPGGVYLYSDGQITKVVASGDPSPVGGVFSTFLPFDLHDQLLLPDYPVPAINNNGAIVFKGRLKSSSASSGIFMASTRAMIKVVATGDLVDKGFEPITDVNSYSVNDLGKVAFFALGEHGRPLGVFLATPAQPAISEVKLKSRAAGLELIVDGDAFINNDSVIEINGKPLEETRYPGSFVQDGGTTTRLISRDPRLAQLLAAGQTLQVTVFNSLTTRRSDPFPLTL